MRNILFLPLCFVLSTVYSQSTQKIGLKDAIKQGVEASKTLKMSQARVEGAEAHFKELKYSQIPDISVGGTAAKLSEIDPIVFGPISIPVLSHNYSSYASISEPIFAGFRAKYLLRSGEYLQNASRFDLEKDRQEVVYNIVNAYFNFYKIKIAKSLLDENQKQIEQHLQDVIKFENAGLATQNEVLKTQLQLSNVELSRIDADNNLKVASYNFSTLLGQQDKVLFEVDTVNVFGVSSINTLDYYLQQATLKREDLKSLDMRVKSSEAAIHISKGKYYPFIAVGANYYYSNPNPRIFPPSDKFSSTWDVGANLKWSLTGIAINKNVVNQTKASAMETQVAYDALSEGVKSEVNQSYYASMQAREKVIVAQKSVVQATENYRIMNVRYNEHVALLTDLLDANLMLLQSKMNLAVAKADSEISYYKLLKSSGILE